MVSQSEVDSDVTCHAQARRVRGALHQQQKVRRASGPDDLPSEPSPLPELILGHP